VRSKVSFLDLDQGLMNDIVQDLCHVDIRLAFGEHAITYPFSHFKLDDFGFKNLLWVYSGRRGVHCWVGDERARQLNNEQRKAIVAYLDVTKV